MRKPTKHTPTKGTKVTKATKSTKGTKPQTKAPKGKPVAWGKRAANKPAKATKHTGKGKHTSTRTTVPQKGTQTAPQPGKRRWRSTQLEIDLTQLPQVIAEPQKAAPKASKPAKPGKKKGRPAGDATPFLPFFNEWKAGASLTTIASREQKEPAKLRYAFVKLAGSDEAFKKLRAAGAGGAAEAFGGKRGVATRVPRTEKASAVSADDTSLPMVTDTSAAAGWSMRRMYRPTTVKLDMGKEGTAEVSWREHLATIYTSPEGVEYVEAKASERANLLRVFATVGIPSVRLRLFAGSAAEREVGRWERIAKHSEAKHGKKVA